MPWRAQEMAGWVMRGLPTRACVMAAAGALAAVVVLGNPLGSAARVVAPARQFQVAGAVRPVRRVFVAAFPPAGYGTGSGYCSGYSGGVDSGFSFDDVYACEGSTTGGTTFDNPGAGVYAWQCVELSARFLWAVDNVWAGPGSGVQDGADLVSVVHANYPQLGVGSPGPGSVPVPGDVISLGPGGGSDQEFGHTAVVVSADAGSGQFEIMSENDPEGSAGEQSLQVDLSGGHDGAVLYNGAWTTASWLEVPTGPSDTAPLITTAATTTFTAAPGDTTSVIRIAASAQTVYELHSDGTIWRYAGPPCGGSPLSCDGWAELDDNPAAAAITASVSTVYQLHTDGSLWQSTGAACHRTPPSCPGWKLIDDNPAITAITGGGKYLYELHSHGSIWRYDGRPCTTSAPPSCPGWTQLDDNPAAAAITASISTVYQLHTDGSLWQSTGTACHRTPLTCPGWKLIDDNPAIKTITADGKNLYELHNDGTIWRYGGKPCTLTAGSPPSCRSWTQLDDNPAAAAITASVSTVYQLHTDGSLWQSTGAACRGTPLTCPGWKLIDDNPAISTITAGGMNLYELHNDGTIWRYDGQPCTITTGEPPSCPSWTLLNASPAVTPGSFALQATGFPTPSFTESGALPAAVTVSPGGVLSGTPQPGTGGTYPMTITASNGVAPDATQSFTLTIDQAPLITSAASATFIRYYPGSFTPAATGYPSPSFTETGALPAGIKLANGTLSGTPAQSGTFTITLTAANGIDPGATQSFTLTVLPLGIITAALHGGILYTAYTGKLSASGGRRPYKWSLKPRSGTLPPGLRLTSAGVITGTPDATGTYTFTIKVTDTKTRTTPRQSATARFTIKIRR